MDGRCLLFQYNGKEKKFYSIGKNEIYMCVCVCVQIKIERNFCFFPFLIFRSLKRRKDCSKRRKRTRLIFSFHRRRWRLPWSRSRGPAPSPDSNYGFHTQARQTEANVESTNGPYSVLNSQSSGPYSVLNTQNGPYTPSTASYSVLETPVPLWGPPPPYSDPNSPARRPQVAEQRPRIAKRIENFENNEGEREWREA